MLVPIIKMKKIILIIIYFLAHILCIQAQTLYGLTPNGGNDGVGSLIKFIPATNNLTVAKSFENYAMYPYHTNLIQASNGKLYGMTLYGGNDRIGGPGYGGGTIFSFDPLNSTYTKLKNFDGPDGAFPNGSLIQASDGKLYGMTTGGGNNNNGYGVIFSFDPSTSTYTKLKDFDHTNGAYSYGSLLQASDGKLYGMTNQGGISNRGVIFSFDPSSSIYTKLKDFDGSNGAHPYGNLMQASNGMLYGMTKEGGNSNNGVIFSFDPSTSIYSKLKDFDGSKGSNPYGSLTQASDGKLYGMTTLGGSIGVGVIFSFDLSSSTYTKLRDFDYPEGDIPFGSLIQASDGKLYGMTADGGSGGAYNYYGVIFSFDPSSSIYTKLKDFDGVNGQDPNGSLMQASDGKLYGMTTLGGTGGGSSSIGVIFSFDPSSSTYTKLKDFEAPNGRNPSSSLTKASNGKLYGMTPTGGHNGVGVIFSFDPSSSIYTKLKDFDYTDGAYPFGSLVQASNGKLYGMTSRGAEGNNPGGVIFSFDPSSSTYIKLMNFDGTNGSYPQGSLVQANNGKLYGMTIGGGSNGDGVIFSFDPSSSTYTKLKDFSIANGAQAYGSLIQASNGKLYGMTYHGGNTYSGYGVIFSFDPSTSIYTKLKVFDDADGAYSRGSLLQASDGKLYGMTYSGGIYDAGVIFSFDPSSSIYSKLLDFDFTNGYHPDGNLMEASDGKLYGMTHQGGSNSAGVIFSFDPLSSTYTKLKDFDFTNTINFYLGSGLIEVSDIALPVTFLNFDGKLKNNQVVLRWSTTNEINNKGYDIERSEDGINFFKIGFVEAKGNTSSISHYTFTDINFNSTVNFYRLKQIDINGNFEYSRIIRINISIAKTLQTVIAPNPFSNVTTISFSLAQSVKVSLKVFDLNGRLIKILADEEMVAGSHEIKWNANNANGQPVPSGVYLLRIEAGDFKVTKKISVIK